MGEIIARFLLDQQLVEHDVSCHGDLVSVLRLPVASLGQINDNVRLDISGSLGHCHSPSVFRWPSLSRAAQVVGLAGYSGVGDHSRDVHTLGKLAGRWSCSRSYRSRGAGRSDGNVLSKATFD